MTSRRPVLYALALSAPLIGAALWLWLDRGWLIALDLAAAGIHSFCL